MVNSLSGWDDLEWQQVTRGQRNKWSTPNTQEGSSRNRSEKLPSILGPLEHSSETLALPHVLWMWLVNSQEEQEAPVRSHVEQQTLWLGISQDFSSFSRGRTLTFLLPHLADYLLPEFLPLFWTFWPIFTNMDGMRRVNSRVDMFGNLVIFKIHSLVHHCHLCHWKILPKSSPPPTPQLLDYQDSSSRGAGHVQGCRSVSNVTVIKIQWYHLTLVPYCHNMNVNRPSYHFQINVSMYHSSGLACQKN